mgnify:CR=1 FL=1
MNHFFFHKAQIEIEAIFLFITISWQPLFGVIASTLAAVYYYEMLKSNVIDKEYDGSVRKYLRSKLKKKK